MFLRGKLCQKKIFKPCLLLAFCFSFLLSCVFSPFASALDRQPNYYNAKFSVVSGPNEWHNNISQNVSNQFSYLYRYEWLIENLQFIGNIANVHFETNIVIDSADGQARFHNTDFLTIPYCGSSGNNINLKSKNISSVQTKWHGTLGSNLRETDNITLTVYGDVILTDLPTTGTHDLYCGVKLSNDWAFAAVLPSSDPTIVVNVSTFAFEQQPTSIVFQSSESEALQQQQIDVLNSINSSINNLSTTIDNSSDYEKEKADLDAKEEEVSDDVDDLSLSASPVTNPFTALFNSSLTNYNVCFTTTSIHNLFGARPFTLCPIARSYSSFVSVMRVASSLVTVCLLIRLYYKKLKGGRDG